jgi:hypothetical protein
MVPPCIEIVVGRHPVVRPGIAADFPNGLPPADALSSSKIRIDSGLPELPFPIISGDIQIS